MRAYTQQTRSTLKILTEQHHLTQWSSWQKYQHVFETQLAYFESCNSEKICGNSDADAMNILHELRSRTSLLDPSRLIPPPELQQDTANLLRSISHEYQKIDRTLQKAYQDGENVCHPQFDIDRDAARIMRKSGVEVEDVVYYSRKLQ